MTTKPLREFQKNSIWVKEYPVRFGGMDISARMTVVRLANGKLLIHSPCEMNAETRDAIATLGQVECIVAPGSFHFSHIESAQQAFPDAETWICPGIERKKPDVVFDWVLGDRPDPRWAEDLDQVFVRGNRIISEAAFFHRASHTLILVDLIENITDATSDVHWLLKFWWKAVFRMWNHPKPAPEYQLGWKDKEAAAKALKRIMEWNFERIIIAHGDLIEEDAMAVATAAWRQVLG